MAMNALQRRSAVEIIEFQKPVESAKNLYVSNISIMDLDVDEASIFVQGELHKAFSKYGLVHSVLPFTSHVAAHNNRCGARPDVSYRDHDCVAGRESSIPTAPESKCRLYAFVNLYSKLSARRAKECLHQTRIVGSNPCKVQFSRRKKSCSPEKTLFLSECMEVANFYLGFDGWATSIKLMKRDDRGVTEEEGKACQSVCRFLCVIELVLPRQGVTTHGIGSADEQFGTDLSRRGGCLSKCRKVAYREALRDAFSRLILVVVGGGAGVKVHAEINHALPQPFMADASLQDPSLLTVTELVEEPREESSGGEEEEGEDRQTIHILAALQSENTQP